MSKFFEDHFVDLTQSTFLDQIVDNLTKDGLVTFAGITSKEQLTTLANSLGSILIQDDTDDQGIKLIDPKAALAGSFLHTDRASMETPPNIIMILCSQQSDQGGESIFADGKKIYQELQENYPGALEAFLIPDSVHFGSGKYLSSGSILNQKPDGTNYIKFRFDKWGYYSASLIKHIPTLLNLMDEYTLSFRLANHQGYIAQNGRWLHGARSSISGERIIYRTILNCQFILSNSEGIGFGFSSS